MSRKIACSCSDKELPKRKSVRIDVLRPMRGFTGTYERHGTDWCARINRRIVERRLEPTFYLLGKEGLGS